MITEMLFAIGMSSTPSCCKAMADMTNDPAFRNLHALPLQVEFTPKYGKMMDVAGGKAFVVPAKKGAKGGVIMIHEFWGLNNQIKQTAEKLYEETGLGVVAVDLYGGKVATTREAAGEMMRAVKEDEATKQMLGTVDAIKNKDLVGKGANKVGTVGYCFGGAWSLQTAIKAGPDVDACVMYYGHPELDPARLKAIHAPVLGNFGNLDTGITPAMVTQFADAMAKAGKSLELHQYEAAHGFANPSNPRHDPKATADSWKHTVAFFKKYL